MHREMTSGRSGVLNILKLIWAHAPPFVRRRFAGLLVLVCTAALLAPTGPLALKLIVDTFTGDATHRGPGIGVFIGLYVLSQWLSRSVGEIRALIYARAGRRMYTALSDLLFSHVMRLPLRYHLQRATGAINQTLENGLNGFQMIVHHLIFTALPVVTQLVATVWILFRIDQPLFLAIFCAAVTCYAVAFSFFIVHATRSAEDASSAAVNASALITDSIIAYETVKFFTAEEVVRKRVRDAFSATEERWGRFYRSYASNGLIVATIFAVFLGLAIALAAREVAAARMTVGEFVLINTFMLQMMQPVELLGYAVQGLSQGAAMLQQMFQLLSEKPEADKESVHIPAESKHAAPPASLEFECVSLAYEAHRHVLRNVSFALPAGRTLGIVGASGAGKSTIVRLLVRLFEPDAGRILLDGIPTSSLSLAELRRAIAVVPQDTILFNETIGYNISFGRFGCTNEEIEEAAKLARLHDFIMSLPQRYETPVGERGVKLSGGEKQRVSIARAALRAPRLFVFDEATSSLDSATERDIVANLRHISAASTTVIIAHRLSTVVHADQIVLLDAGQIVERGRHDALTALGGKYAALWNAQHAESLRATSRAQSERAHLE